MAVFEPRTPEIKISIVHVSTLISEASVNEIIGCGTSSAEELMPCNPEVADSNTTK